MKRLCIIIPAYQAAATLPELIQASKQYAPELPIFVIDDGSTDHTSQILPGLGVIYLRHAVNQGKGAALQRGINAALKAGFTHAIFMDADLQHPPASLPEFMRAFEQSKCPLILGKRTFHLGVMPIHRILSNIITSFMLSLRSARRVHDSQCGFRIVELPLLANLSIRSRGFQFESETLLRLLLAAVPYREIAIPTIYNGAASSINNIGDTLRFIRLFLSSYFW
jgi:glycosyltransferase involved in cell wall biosynthesis